MTRKDIIALKRKFDKMKVPLTGRILVLCPDHVSDLLELDQKFAQQYYNYLSGKVSNLYGFEVYEYVDAPYYTVSTKTKAAFGAVVTDAMAQASVAYHVSRVMKANGTVLCVGGEKRHAAPPQSYELLAAVDLYAAQRGGVGCYRKRKGGVMHR